MTRFVDWAAKSSRMKASWMLTATDMVAVTAMMVFHGGLGTSSGSIGALAHEGQLDADRYGYGRGYCDDGLPWRLGNVVREHWGLAFVVARLGGPCWGYGPPCLAGSGAFVVTALRVGTLFTAFLEYGGAVAVWALGSGCGVSVAGLLVEVAPW